ncbi:MAG: hypothetical protein CMI68_05630 [Candidatus Pelagibacter sp.]|nr:hypothetical protein [Candidatus Pelagibacter sp.]
MDIKQNGSTKAEPFHIDKNIITEVISKYKDLDIAITDPEWDEKKQNYKKVYYWKDKPKVNGAAALNSKQLIIRNTNEYPEVDWDIFKHLEPWQAQYIKDKLPKTFEFGRDGRGHSLYKVKNLPENPESTKSLELGARTLLEYRAAGSYSIFAGQLDKTSKATTAGKEIAEIDYKYLKKLFNRAAALAALTIITPGNKEVINNFLLAAAGEFYVNKILKTTTIKIFKSWLHLIKRTDRENETVKSIEGIYKSGRASNIFSKNYPVPISEAEKYQFREIVKRVGLKYEDKPTESMEAFEGMMNGSEEPQTKELKGYCLNEYIKLPIKVPKFLIERLFKENSINFISGPKGNGKTELILGFCNALVRGLNVLKYTCPEEYPITLIDGEMDPYDMVERNNLYIAELGPPKKDYFHIINYAQQLKQTIPDIKGNTGQQLILNYALKQEKLVGKKPIIVLDNLRSLSNYKENESDEWLPIGKWLVKMRGLGFTIIVVDHHGKEAKGPRGTSSKTDWANVSLLVTSDKEKGNPNMRMSVKFDKARGLKPDETDDFIAEYDFQGTWFVGDSKQKQSDEEFCKQIYDRITKQKAYSIKYLKSLDKDLVKGTVTKEAYETILKNHKQTPSQKDLAGQIGIAAGKVNRLMKKGGPYEQWCVLNSNKNTKGEVNE